MKVMHFSTFDLRGGAAQAAHRLHAALLDIDVDSHMAVQFNDSNDHRIHGPVSKLSKARALMRDTLAPLPKIFYAGSRKHILSFNWLPGSMESVLAQYRPDIVHLHWINAGFLPMSFVRRCDIPLVWTLHDMWPMTGGCHYASSCDQFRASCGRCPMLASNRASDVSRWQWKNKSKNFAGKDFSVIAPSQLMVENASRSSLLGKRDIRYIPHGIELETYMPADKRYARRVLRLPADRKLVLIAAARGLQHPGKGFEHIFDVIAGRDVELVVLGSWDTGVSAPAGVNVHFLGRLNDDQSRSLAYSAVDVIASLSPYESFGLSVLEAMACGTPAVVFPTGIFPALVSHRENGYLAKSGDTDDFSKGLDWCLGRQNAEDKSRSARLAAEKFDAKEMAQRHLSLYQSLMMKKG